MVLLWVMAMEVMLSTSKDRAAADDDRRCGQATPALGSPNNRRGSTQVIALHADISCGDSDALQVGFAFCFRARSLSVLKTWVVRPVRRAGAR
eukprot:2891143-Rhodomonas_salina.2